jgi:predicted regulator of Ras-like GTPase activity (Roadblock/LC7/MglB family)
MQDVLQPLLRQEGVAGAIVYDDGQVLASTGYDEETALQAALLGAVFASLRKGLDELGAGPLREAIIEAEDANILGVQEGSRLVLVVTHKGANTGLVRLELRKVLRRLVGPS